jgi:hypothetical protein
MRLQVSPSHEAPVAAVESALEWSFSCLYVFGKKFTLVFGKRSLTWMRKCVFRLPLSLKVFPQEMKGQIIFGLGAGLGDTHEGGLDVFDLQVVLYRITCTALLAIVSLVER